MQEFNENRQELYVYYFYDGAEQPLQDRWKHA